jgi:hypothetical protein
LLETTFLRVGLRKLAYIRNTMSIRQPLGKGARL